MFVGLLSDTHGVFSKEFADFLSPVDVIWHAGDWGGGLGFVQQIRDLGKPVLGVYGNCDGLDIREEFPEYQLFSEEGVRVLMTHIGGSPGHYYPRAAELLRACKPDLFVCGHSHILKVAWDGGAGLGYGGGARAAGSGVAGSGTGSGGNAGGASVAGSCSGAGSAAPVASPGAAGGAVEGASSSAAERGFLYMNPGAAGIQGWQVVRTALRFKLQGGRVEALEVFNLPR